MLTGHRPAMRRRTQRSRAARIAVPLAIPVALGLTLGIVIAVSSSSHSTPIKQSAFGASPSASASASPTASASSPAAVGTNGAAATTVAPASSFATGPVATFKLGGLATTPVDGTGDAISLNQTPGQAAASLNCSLAVPANPLTAQGLATPWQLGDGCSMANAGTQGAFVE